MEDIEKYVFDPEHPKGFKAFKLLKNLLLQKNTIAYIDRLFLLEIFNKDIFDIDYKDQLWDLPKNYNELSTLDKKRLYIENYSPNEFNDFLISKSKNFSPHKLSNFTSSFIGEENKLASLGFALSIDNNDGLFKQIPEFNIYEKLNETYLKKALEGTITKDLRELNLGNYHEIIINKNFIFIIGEKREFDIIKKFKLVRSSILITSIKNQKEFSKVNVKNLKPIFLKNTNDIHKLIDLAKRNLNKNHKKSPYNKSVFASSFNLKNYFSIKNIYIENLSSKKEIYFLGENGDGKSLILQSILLSLKGSFRLNIGLIADFIKQNTSPKLFLEAIDSSNKKYKFVDGVNQSKEQYENIFAYGVNRFQNDSDKKDQHGFLTLFSHNEYLENPVKWLQHLDYQEKSDNQPDIELSKAKELLSDLLEKNVEIEVSPSGVDFYERGTKLKFEQLSDGYKSVLVWMCDLLSRLAKKQPETKHIFDFHGIVLVDEIGMFLHPKWQRTIVKKLRTTFPNIQFFFTTHSPIVLLGASEDAIFYKVYKEDGETKVSDPIENKSLGHLMANGIITAPFLFGLESARNEVGNKDNSILDTSEDYLTGEIHRAISKRIAQKNNISEDQIMDLIQKELDKYEAQTND